MTGFDCETDGFKGFEMTWRDRFAVSIMCVVFPLSLIVGSTLSDMRAREEPLKRRLGLPAGAKDVTVLGEGWHTFTVTVGGRERTILRRYEPGAHSDTEAFTEVR
jgi:hypothetical protein